MTIGASIAWADVPLEEGAVAVVNVPAPSSEYPVLTRGRVLLVNAQRFVVTQEPPPLATSSEAPPEPEPAAANRPASPYAGAIWVAGHWSHGASGFVWVSGRYVAPRPGHVFVPPRWAVLDDRYFYFTGFYVPHGVYVRSYFNRYYYSGPPQSARRIDRGPYWPVGAPTRANSALGRAGARDPYWPIGLR